MFKLPKIAELPFVKLDENLKDLDKAGTYYTYVLVNPFTGKPFYVGKGNKEANNRRERHLDHERDARQNASGRNNHKLNTIRKIWNDGGQVEYHFYEDLNEETAYLREMQLIQFWGRRDNKTGILTNRTDGGEGRLNSKHSEEALEANRKAHLGENNATSILTDAQVRKIHTYALEHSYSVVAEHFSNEFGVSARIVRGIIYGEKWPHIYKEFHDKPRGKGGSNNGNSKLNDAIVEQILREPDNGMSKNKLAMVLKDKYGISKNSIINIRDGKTWRHIYDKVKLSLDLK